jgi:hypothetical protein
MGTNLAVLGHRWFGDDAATRTRRMLHSTAPKPDKGENADKKKRPRHFDAKVLDEIHKVFRREAPKAGGEPKKGAFTTVVAGRTHDMDETTWVVLYFTHFGSFGDVVEDMLRLRREERCRRLEKLREEAKKKGNPIPKSVSEEFETIDITCDASSANNPKHDYDFALRYFGCAMHARRKFVEIPEQDRSEEVNRVIHYFSFLYAMEEWLSEIGRTPKRVGRMRYRWGTWAWETICYEAELILKKADASNAEIKAATYVVENFETLQRFLDCLFSVPDNGISERYLRPVRLAENTTHGLETERGRLVKDVLRSMIATCRAIGVPFEEYLPWLLAQCDPLPGEKKLHRSMLTPHAFLPVWRSRSRPTGSQAKG